jgi:hypothetical protein
MTDELLAGKEAWGKWMIALVRRLREVWRVYQEGTASHSYTRRNGLEGSGLGITANTLSAGGHAEPEREAHTKARNLSSH